MKNPLMVSKPKTMVWQPLGSGFCFKRSSVFGVRHRLSNTEHRSIKKMYTCPAMAGQKIEAKALQIRYNQYFR